MSDDGNESAKGQLRDLISEALAGNVFSSIVRLDQYSGHPNKDLLQFIEEFEALADANKLSEEIKIRKLQLYLRDSAKDWYDIYIKEKNKNWEK